MSKINRKKQQNNRTSGKILDVLTDAPSVRFLNVLTRIVCFFQGNCYNHTDVMGAAVKRDTEKNTQRMRALRRFPSMLRFIRTRDVYHSPYEFHSLSAFPVRIEKTDISPASQRHALNSYWRSVSGFIGLAYNREKERIDKG